jgi:hypothetical protein
MREFTLFLMFDATPRRVSAVMFEIYISVFCGNFSHVWVGVKNPQRQKSGRDRSTD